MRAASVSGIVSGDVPVSYWPIFLSALVLVTVPEVFAKLNSTQFFFQFFLNGQLLDRQILEFPPSSSK